MHTRIRRRHRRSNPDRNSPNREIPRHSLIRGRNSLFGRVGNFTEFLTANHGVYAASPRSVISRISLYFRLISENSAERPRRRRRGRLRPPPTNLLRNVGSHSVPQQSPNHRGDSAGARGAFRSLSRPRGSTSGIPGTFSLRAIWRVRISAVSDTERRTQRATRTAGENAGGQTSASSFSARRQRTGSGGSEEKTRRPIRWAGGVLNRSLWQCSPGSCSVRKSVRCSDQSGGIALTSSLEDKMQMDGVRAAGDSARRVA